MRPCEWCGEDLEPWMLGKHPYCRKEARRCNQGEYRERHRARINERNRAWMRAHRDQTGGVKA